MLLLLFVTPRIVHVLQARSNTREVVAVFSQVDDAHSTSGTSGTSGVMTPPPPTPTPLPLR